MSRRERNLEARSEPVADGWLSILLYRQFSATKKACDGVLL